MQPPRRGWISDLLVQPNGSPVPTATSLPAWPELPYLAWRDTYATLHLWSQVVGKIRLALTPWINHSWHVALYVSTRGLTTSPIPYQQRSFEIEFDFLAQTLTLSVSDGGIRRIPLAPQSVAQFYASVLGALGELGIEVRINDYPCEIASATRFSADEIHRSYDPEQARRFCQGNGC